MRNNFLLYIITIFVLLSAVFFGIKHEFPAYNFKLLMLGNTIMAILALVTFFLVQQKIHDRPQVFVRGVYSASFLKMMVCMILLLLYVLLNRQQIHKPSILALFGIYAVYTTVETLLLAKMARKK